jgi:hypothetical protein
MIYYCNNVLYHHLFLLPPSSLLRTMTKSHDKRGTWPNGDMKLWNISGVFRFFQMKSESFKQQRGDDFCFHHRKFRSNARSRSHLHRQHVLVMHDYDVN